MQTTNDDDNDLRMDRIQNRKNKKKKNKREEKNANLNRRIITKRDEEKETVEGKGQTIDRNE